MDYYKDGTYRRTIKGTKAKIGDKVIMGLNPAVGSPDDGIYPRVNEPTPAYDPVTQRLVTTFTLNNGKSVRSYTVEAHPNATERQADEDARAAQAEADTDVRDSVGGDAFLALLDTAKANRIRTRLQNIMREGGAVPTLDGIEAAIIKLALALANERRK